MAEYRKKVVGETVVGMQQASLRTTIPREITNVIKINMGDHLKWQFDPTQEKPIITVEVESMDDDGKTIKDK